MGTTDVFLGKIKRDRKYSEVFRYAHQIAPIVADHFGEGKTGGVATFLGVFSPSGLINMVQSPVGVLDPEKEDKFWSLSAEKAMRGVRYLAPNSYVANRNPDLLQYGGAFALGDPRGVWFSFSGWPEKVDIAFGIFCLNRWDIITHERACDIFHEHGEVASEIEDIFNRMGGQVASARSFLL